MKKVLAALVSGFILMSTLSVGVSAGKGAPASEEVRAEMRQTAAYVMAQYLENTDEGMMYQNAQYLVPIVKSGIACNEISQKYQKDLKAVLDANGGKLLYSGSESVGSYALAIEALEAMGQDPAKFGGYNLYAALSEVKELDANPYMLAYALSTVAAHKDKITSGTLENSLLDALNAVYKESGAEAGWDNWGINVDNNGTIITALAPYYSTNETVKNQIDKALAYNETMKTDAGYTNWGSPNASSTALALQALSAIKDYDGAQEAYELLKTYKDTQEQGAYTYSGEANLYASAGALEGLRYYMEALAAKEEAERPVTPPTEGTMNPVEDTTGTGDSTVEGTPETGDVAGWVLVSGLFALVGAAGAIALRKKSAQDEQ